MLYIDRLYGPGEIAHPLLIELINSSPLQRLKEVDQTGYSEPFHRGLRYSRFEHSLGVMLLLGRFSASLEEQVAGLLHDVSHSAFSHCIDYVSGLGSPQKHSHQDDILGDYMTRTAIPKIVQSHGLSFTDLLDDKRHPLKERELPDLCADRLDYSLRTAVVAGDIEQLQVDYFLTNLEVGDGHWIFKNEESARKYAELFLHLNNTYFAGLASAVMFHTVGNYLTRALRTNCISLEDLYTTDDFVLRKILPFHNRDAVLLGLYKRMTLQTEYFEAPRGSPAARVFCKSRVVDPLCRTRRGTQPLSQVIPQWQKVVAEQSRPREYLIGFHDNLPCSTPGN